MAKNPLQGFNKPLWELDDQDNIEHDLIKSVVGEYCDIAGIKILYYKIDNNINDFDQLYGELKNLDFMTPIKTKIIYEIDQEPNLYSVFGLYGDDSIISYIPKSTFYRDIDKTKGPVVGDVITTIWNNRNYEIVGVQDSERVFQLYKYLWILNLKPYRLSDESESAVDISDSLPVSAYFDNDWIEDQSNDINDYSDVDSKIYGF